MKSRESKREDCFSLSLSLRFGLEQKMRYFGGLDFLGYLYMRHVAHIVPCVTFPSVIFPPEIIYFIPISVPFILNENSLNI